MQIKLRDMGKTNLSTGTPLPKHDNQMLWLWFAFGFPASGPVLCIPC